MDLPPRDESSLQATLIDFAACDAGFLLCAFLRSAWLFVHADSAALVYRPHLQRALALRLLSSCAPIAHRFTWLCMNDFGDRMKSVQTPDDSDNVRHLARRVRNSSRAESSALVRLIRRTDVDFGFRNSAFDPIRYARNLERSFQDCVDLTPTDMDVVFQCWAEVFSRVMRDAYSRYRNFLESQCHMILPMRQEVDDIHAARPGIRTTSERHGHPSSPLSLPPRLQKNPLRNRCS